MNNSQEPQTDMQKVFAAFTYTHNEILAQTGDCDCDECAVQYFTETAVIKEQLRTGVIRVTRKTLP